MHILFWNQEYFPSLGGVENYTKNLAETLLRQGHKVAVITSLHPGLPIVENMDGVTVYRLPFYQTISSRDMEKIADIRSRVKQIKDEIKPDIVHVNFTDASPFFHLTTWRNEEKTILVFHYPLDNLSQGISLADQLLRKSSAWVAISEFMAAHVSEKIAGTSGKLEVIRNGADESLFSYSHPEGRSKGEFIFVGRLVEEKGPHVILQAIEILNRKGIRVKLKLIGAGPYRSVLEADVARLQLEHQVEFVGRLGHSDLSAALKSASAVVIPSLFKEPGPLVAVEVSMAGIPIIGSRIGGLPNVVQDGKTGLLFEPGDPTGLAEHMELLAAKPELALEMGNAARMRSRDIYTLTRMMDSYIALYHRVLHA